jgi:hypothetical protein
MAGPLIPVAAAILGFIAKKGINAAVKKYGAKAVKQAQKQKNKQKDLIESDGGGSSLNEKEFKSKAKSDTYKKHEQEIEKAKREKYDPSFDKMAKSITQRRREIAEKLKEAREKGDQKGIEALQKRLKNLSEMEKDDFGTLVHKGTGGKFSKGGLTRTGHKDYRKTGMFN